MVLAMTTTPPASADDLEVHWRGLLDLVASENNTATALNLFNMGDSNFDPYRLRLFAEAKPAETFAIHTQFLYEEYAGVRAIGAYALYTPDPDLDVHVMAGKIPWLVGTYQSRTYSNKNPLIGAPLMYQYHTSLRIDYLPPSVDALLSAAGTGQFGPVYDATGRGYRGLAVVYDLCWDVGAMVTGGVRPFEFAAGVVSGAPSMMSTKRDNNSGKSVLGRVGAEPWPGVRFGVSGSYGPYISDQRASQVPAGKTVNAYAQKLVMADAEWLFGHVDLRGEAFDNTWETPTAGNLRLRGGYMEAKVVLPQGAYAAARYDVFRYANVSDSLGVERPWDHDVDRIEAGLGYRVTRSTTLKGVFQRTTLKTPSGNDPYDLFALQASIGF